MVHRSDPDLAVLLALRLASFAPTDEVARRSGVVEADAGALLDRFAGDGLVRFRDGRRSGWSLTTEGRSAGERLLAAEVDALGARELVEGSYQRFLDENPVMLQVCTDWQLRPDPSGEPVLNAHDDLGYDRAVLDQLGALHDRAVAIWQPLGAVLERFSSYHDRFGGAIARVRAGEHDWFTKPSIDSYHTVWFELHEHLLATLNIDRADEAAGRTAPDRAGPARTGALPVGES